MTWRPKLVALDVDGTLVDGDNVMTPAVRETVRAIRESGIETVITTGRAIPGVLNTAALLDFDDAYAIASNGAIVFTYNPVEILNLVTFDASEAVRRVLEHVPDALVAVEDIGVGYRLNKPFPSGEINGKMTVEPVESLISEPVTRVVIRSPEHSQKEFATLVEDLGLSDTNYYIGYTAWLDLAPEGVSKASGLTFLCDRLGIAAADVLAVGDGNNDVEMVKWAGRGVAMSHGPASLLAVADHVTGTVEEDGLVAELQRYL
ncbi:Cof subfamily protein (haloacid dehalogenase superfamily) [Aeromicrobium panaciterrae]|uniref:Cof subfamily protein (Haloacid dehalogenase superfamily) n=1 Tax=Aeromicrobium panaciterrae TaxID=363861 RepID=A0ABU1UJY5_9ACTN|nr:HAD family hydrolase [Aeromicrobium panaciterrae]MDR7085451.1 Cof subfamily protein (haloacid dehalogenase superfamily) [Aeromicrobium panaciterrae]